MSGHTPSPWRLESPNEGGRVLAMDDRETIVHSPPANPFNEQVMADARLIAAAPELLEACQMIAEYPNTGPAMSAIRAAIAKATGETP